LLARSGFVSEKDGAITIGFLSTQTLRSVEAEIAHPALIRAVAARFGDGASILPIRDPDGRFGRTLHEEIERQRAAMRVAIDTAARADDAVQRTLAAFPEARIEEVLLPDLQEIEDVQ
jgi:hypothetical protein